MLRPAPLLSTKWTFDAPLGRSTSLPSPGACYRALRRLPGQVLHLLEERVFQDAPCGRLYLVWIASDHRALESSQKAGETACPTSDINS